jgi:hypothetical protein
MTPTYLCAPIALFVYSRPQHTKHSLDALAQNDLARKTILYVFCDGPKEHANQEQLDKIAETREVIRNEGRFKQVIIKEQSQNRGLARSIIDGVTEVVNQYGSAIVWEDDIVCTDTCLSYLNTALKLYKDDERVLSVSAYKPPTANQPPSDSFFLPFSFPWGWAVWNRSWQNFEPDSRLLKQKVEDLNLVKSMQNGYYDYYEMLKQDIEGVVNSWFVRFYAYHYTTKGICLYPSISQTKNIGFDSSGEHCGTDDYFSTVPMGRIPALNRLPNISIDPIIWKEFANEISKREFERRPDLYAKVVRKLKKLTGLW